MPQSASQQSWPLGHVTEPHVSPEGDEVPESTGVGSGAVVPESIAVVPESGADMGSLVIASGSTVASLVTIGSPASLGSPPEPESISATAESPGIAAPSLAPGGPFERAPPS